MPIMPVFVFIRHHDIELETNLVLAGHLIVDIPKRHKLSKKQQRMITELIKHLAAENLPDDAIIYGWPNGRRPVDADNTINNDELMSSWADTRWTIGVRVDPRPFEDMREGLRMDSEMLRQMGLAHPPSGQH